MLGILQKVLGILVIISAGYGLIFKELKIMPYTQFLVAGMLLVIGIKEIKEERKNPGIINIFASIFIFLVAIFILLDQKHII